MAFVLDASVTACWAFQDEDQDQAELALDVVNREGALVPGLWWFEVRAVLIKNERRNRIKPEATVAFLARLSRLGIRIDAEPDEVALLTLARTHELSVYDATYLELAQRHGIPLATLDMKLAQAARSEKVPMLVRKRLN